MSSAYIKLPHDARPCLCSVCVCGRHQCPGVFCMQPLGATSHYRDTFTPKKGERDFSPRARVQPLVVKAAPGQFLTTYQTATEPIQRTKVDRAPSYKPTPTVPPSAPFDGRTTQKVDFPGHIPKLPPRPPMQHGFPKVPGVYDTTLGAMQQPVMEALKNGTLHRSQSAGHRAQPLPQLPFDGLSSYKVHFPPKQNAEPAHSCSPRSSSAAIRENRDFISTKAASYVPLPAPERPPCPAALAPIRPPSRDGHIKVVEVSST